MEIVQASVNRADYRPGLPMGCPSGTLLEDHIVPRIHVGGIEEIDDRESCIDKMVILNRDRPVSAKGIEICFGVDPTPQGRAAAKLAKCTKK